MRPDEEKVDPVEALLEAQQELASLQRTYRTLSNDKKVYTSEAQNVIRRQKAAIEMLLQEREQLSTLNNVAGRAWNKFCDDNNLNALNELLNKEQEVLQEIETEKKMIAETEIRERAIEEKIADWRRTMKGSKDTNITKYIATQKQIRVRKNRLDGMNKKFNSAMTENKKLREKIDEINKQKVRFQELHQRLENKLSEVKKDIESISENATANFHARDEAQHRMTSLRERGERDLATFNSEIKDFMREIEHDRKLRDFMSAKTRDRASILREETLKRELRKHSIHLDSLNIETEKYETIFEKMKEATGIHDTATLVASFIKKEDENFALFNYVNAINTEIEGLQENIQILQDEIEQTKQDEIVSDNRRKVILKELEQQLKTVTTQYCSMQKEAKTNRHILEKAKPKIEKLFKMINCDRKAISELLGGGTTIDDCNIVQYLGIIEQKCNEMLQIRALHRMKSGAELHPKEVHILEGLQGVGPKPAQPILAITPPNIEEENDIYIQVTDTKPLTMNEVQNLCAQHDVTSRCAWAIGSRKSIQKTTKKKEHK